MALSHGLVASYGIGSMWPSGLVYYRRRPRRVVCLCVVLAALWPSGPCLCVGLRGLVAFRCLVLYVKKMAMVVSWPLAALVLCGLVAVVSVWLVSVWPLVALWHIIALSCT